jgi:hypothetical protein
LVPAARPAPTSVRESAFALTAIDTRPTPPRNAIVVLKEPPSPKYDMISARCNRAATSGYESLKTPDAPEPRFFSNGSNAGALRSWGYCALNPTVYGPCRGDKISFAPKKTQFKSASDYERPSSRNRRSVCPSTANIFKNWLAQASGHPALCAASQCGDRLDFVVGRDVPIALAGNRFGCCPAGGERPVRRRAAKCRLTRLPPLRWPIAWLGRSGRASWQS